MAVLSLASQPARASTVFTVDSTGDGLDNNTGDGLCNDGSGACTFRAAIEQANATPGQDSIHFSIGSGVQTIDIGPPQSLPTLTDPVTIDGTTQPGFAGSPLVVLNGRDSLPGLRITAGNSIVRGLVMNRMSGGAAIQISANGENIVEGNFIGTDATGTVELGNNANIIIESSNNVVGGTTAAARNVISGSHSYGVLILDLGNGATRNLIQGNFIGTDVTGTVALGNINGISIAADNNVVGGTSAGARNVISGNEANGVDITGGNPEGNLVLGNFIGTDATGGSAIGNDTGVQISGFSGVAANNIIGAMSPDARNIISGNRQFGVLLYSSDGGNLIQGNYIGTDAGGVHPLGNLNGIGLFAHGEVVGGTEADEGNLIAFNTGYGVDVFQASTAITIRGNSIHSNGYQGIINHNNDNLEVPPPVITAAGSASGTTCATCIVDVYSDYEDEGRIYHGSTTAAASGSWSFEGAVLGPNVTATATDMNWGTSEFSGAFNCAANGADPDGDGLCNSSDPTPLGECAGVPVTIRGGDGPDAITGTVAPDVIHGAGGDDFIRGREGNDTICGGNGRDRIMGQDGNDVLHGEAGNDTLSGGKGADLLDGGPDSDRCNGGEGDDAASLCEAVANIP